ncbi:hypothetical protein LPTSP3_g32250 [Leptospira kobayashii]|uniref:Transcriptional regulator n=1 Tax=Leptospira kobayashii TaxID=1917830 RepID=A0ABM7UMI3_9LEPT|nr:transcriptional regulator [Leptospira kobayashii]BDA80295.1 hypothetical protein LPTSP3_g32250 [Leptospira kobayashii]
MDKFNLEKDINVFCVTAISFPDGVMDAHNKLHSLIKPSKERRYFGISRPDKDTIVYKAAAEEMEEGEADKLSCERFVIKKGEFICLTIKDFMEDVQSIENAFRKLISRDDIDPNGYCLEWYLNEKDVRCMVGLKS